MNTLLLTNDECESILNALLYNTHDPNIPTETRGEWAAVYKAIRDKMFAQGYYHRIHDPGNSSSKHLYENLINT